MSSEGTIWDWQEIVRRVLQQKGVSAAESVIVDFLREPVFREFTMTILMRTSGRRYVPIAVLPEHIAQGKPLLVVNDKIATKLRIKHKIRHEEYCRLQELLKG